MNLTLDGKGALYDQIARALKLEILEGRIAAGSKLPSTRVLATALGVSRKSVLQSYDLLCAEELAIARAGSGTRVAKAVPMRKASSEIGSKPQSQYAARIDSLPPVSLGAGHLRGLKYNLLYGEPLVDSALFHSWRRKLSAAALRAGPSYPRAGGYLPLRRAIADYLGRRRGVICDASEILIVGGTQQALTIVERTLLDPGDRVVVEDPHYQLAVHSLLAHGAQLVSVRTDEQGLVVRELPKGKTRLVFVAPSHQFPSGVAMTLARRLDLLRWAAQGESWIVEDDYDSEFHAGEGSLPAMRSLDLADRVIYVGSFSKTLFPSLRLGYIVCPRSLRDHFFKAKMLDDLGSPALEQAALATFIQSGQYERHLRKTVTEIAARRHAIVEALQRLAENHIELGPHRSGMHFVVWFRRLGFDRLDAFIERAKSVGLGLHPVHPYYRHMPARPGLLLGYAGLSPAQLKTAADLFARCCEGM
ncbi:MAG TPA: PLP-dependent aminotransferase family protein [Steroidobacteraceae bacterium]|jgi:GntR family transcriptional regulator/MocR family aminotransferase|nr:PLP-dependent aminotransferase family protein [Steroidobacteraceae bacterium]